MNEETVTPASPPACTACGSGRDADTGMGRLPFVYAIGRIEPRYPSLASEKEMAQAVGRAETARMTDREATHAVLAQRSNRYLARQLCWVLSIQGLDTYLLQPRDPADLDLLVESIRPRPGPHDQDAVIGVRAGTAPPEMCNGLTLPVVVFDQIYSFDRNVLVASVPGPEGAADKDFRPSVEAVFDRVIQMTGNAGASDEHRALNYLAVRYPALYATTAAAFARGAALSAVHVRRSPMSGPRAIVDVILCHTDRKTDVTEKHAARVDVTEEFPFLVTKLTPYFDF